MIKNYGWTEDMDLFPITNNIFVRVSTDDSFAEPVENKYGYFSFDDLFLLIPYMVTEMNNDGIYEQKIKRLSDAPLSKKRISLRYALNLMSNHEAGRLFEKGLEERDDFQNNAELDVSYFKKKRFLHISLSLIFCMLITEKEVGLTQTRVLSENNKVIKSSEKIETIYVDFLDKNYFINDLYDDIKANYLNYFKDLYKETAQDELEIFMQNIESRDLYLFENYEELRKQSMSSIEEERSIFENCVHKNEKNHYSEIEKYIESYLIDFEYRYEKKLKEENEFLQEALGSVNKNMSDIYQERTTLNSVNHDIEKRKQMIMTTSERVKQQEYIMNGLISSIKTFRMGISYLITKKQFESEIKRLQAKIMDKTSIESIIELNSAASDFNKIVTSRKCIDEKKVKNFALNLGITDLSLLKQCIAELYSEPFDNFFEEYILQNRIISDVMNEKEKVKHKINLLFSEYINKTFEKNFGKNGPTIKEALVGTNSISKHLSSLNKDNFHSYYTEFSDLLVQTEQYPKNRMYNEEFRVITDLLAYTLSFTTLKLAKDQWLSPFFLYLLESTNEPLWEKHLKESELGIKKFIISIHNKNENAVMWELIQPCKFLEIVEKICQPFDREALKIAYEISKKNTALLKEVNANFSDHKKVKAVNEEIKRFREPFYRNYPNSLGSPEYKISSTIQLVYEKRFNKILTRLIK